VNVLRTDGTSFRCDRYELMEQGVKLYSGDSEERPDRYESDTDDHQIGFVPDGMLLYILPEGVSPAGVATARPARHQPGQPTQHHPGQPAQQPSAGAPSVTRQPSQRELRH